MEDGGERNLYQHHYHHPHHHHRRLHDHTPSSSSLSTAPDDISVFLHQLLLRSSSSPSMAGNDSPATLRRLSDGKGGVFTDPGDGFLSSVSGASFSGNVGFAAAAAAAGGGGNVPSSSVGNETDHDHEYDCESEEGLEALVEEGHIKHSNQRNSSKRTRAAEVHNQSEKRRRSRINEKMKALQNLIPNSNKTDKASMLDEAIEYLKQLQLQVQMLSMRNGLSLHPMSLPGALRLSQARMGVGEENHPSFHMNLLSGQENVFCLPDHPSLPVMSDIINPVTSFGLESQFGSFQVQAAPEEICREDVVSRRLGNIHCSDPNSIA